VGFFALLLCAAPALAQPAYKVEATDHQKVRATASYEITTTKFAVSKWMAFLSEPPELPSQREVKTTFDPTGVGLAEKSLLARRVRYFERAVSNPAPGGNFKVSFTTEATLMNRKLVELKDGEKPPAVPALTADERKYYLSSTTRVDHDAQAFKDWLDRKKLRLIKGEHAFDFAARVLDVIRADYRYFYDPNEDKRASVACKRSATDCGGMCYLFVGALRANGVPARVLVGRYAKPRKPGSTPADTGYENPHVRAEMYAPGVGWVPVDPTNAHANRNQKTRAFVGVDPGDVLVLHLDVDLKLPFPDAIRDCQFLQVEPFYWTQGKGTFDGRFGPSGWDIKVTPLGTK